MKFSITRVIRNYDASWRHLYLAWRNLWQFSKSRSDFSQFSILTDLLDAPHYVEVAYEPTPEVKQNEMLDDSKPENNWQNFLVDPVETSPDSSLGVFKVSEKKTNF